MLPAEQQMQFVFTLRSRGVTNADVLKAMEATPRAEFLEGIFQERAYEDTPLPIACGQTISQPTVVGLMTQALEVTRRCKVLEIGTGSGYQAAILSRLARRVYTVERHRRLARRTRELLQRLALHNITVVHADGSLGLPEQAPFDRIIVTAAAEDPPQVLLDQLREGGVMVLPVGQSNAVQTLIRIVKTPCRPRLHRPRRRALRAPCRRGRAGRIGLAGRQGTMGRTAMATNSLGRRARSAVALSALFAGALALTGCGSAEKLNPFGGGGEDLATPPPPAVANPQPNSRGVITYATYQVVVAQEGDKLSTIADRLGTTPGALSRRNALPADYILHPGEVLLLPDSVPRPADGLDSGTVTSQPLGWTPDQASAAIDSAGGGTATAAGANPFQNGQKQPLIDPVRHRVESGETAYSIARLYGVSVTALASWNGLGPDLAVRPNQELLIPIVSDANRISSSADTQPGQGTPVAAPPIAATPLPADIAEAVDPASPDLGQYRTPPGGRLAAPVSGKVVRKYNPGNPNGIGFDVPAGTAVHAAASGEVALVSEALGGLGTIVLVRHKDDLITTYSTLADVRVKEGDRVTTGEVLGTVAPRDKPELQFDVFRGTTSVDPTPYISGG